MQGRAEASSDEDEEQGQDREQSLAEREATGRSAGPSGRSGEITVLEDATSFAKLQKGEQCDQEVFAATLSKKPTKWMIELEAGCGIYIQGYPEKWSMTELLVDLPREPASLSSKQWINRRSSRIWRGSNATKYWTHMESGQWKPRHASGKKAVRCKSKGRAGRRRSESAVHREDEGTEMTGTTRASGGHDSDEEMEAGDSPSPLPVRDSKAVSPEDDGLKDGRKDTFYTEGARGGAAKGLGERIVVKTEPGTGPSPQPGPRAASAVEAQQPLEGWFACHWSKLHQRGLLNRSPDGCNPESGRVPGLASAGSNRTGQGSMKGREASSSSGSAGQGHTTSQIAPVPGNRQDGCRKDRLYQLVKGKAIKTEMLSECDPARSPSPATPNKPGDGCRAAEHRQRSSSVDGDPRSWTAGPVPLDQQKGHKPSHLARGSQPRGAAAVRAKPPAAAARVAWAGAKPDQTRPSRTASSPGVDKSQQGQHRQGPAKPVNGAVRKEGKVSSPLKVPSLKQQQQGARVVKPQMKVAGSRLVNSGTDSKLSHRGDLKGVAGAKKSTEASPPPKRHAEAKTLLALLDLDPFAEPEAKKVKVLN